MTSRVVTLLCVLLAGGARADPRVAEVAAIGITVADADRAADFYGRVLGFTVERDVEVTGEPWERLRELFPVRMRVVTIRLGDERLELTEYLTPSGKPAPIDARSNDRWFQHAAIVVADMDRAHRWLRDRRVAQISPEPQRLPDWNPAAGGIRAFYFRDPDGHPLELIWYPPGRGDPRWQAAGERLFLGIDHTAIVVADTASSRAFYERLGFRVTGASENYGPEQERLNAVRGARLRITTLRALRGPGVELLEYLAPSGGRPYPEDARASDLAHWRTRLVVAAGTLDERATVVPPRVLGFTRGRTERDPDGHVLELVEP